MRIRRYGLLMATVAAVGLARAADDTAAPAAPAGAEGTPAQSPQGLARWFDPSTAPFIPVPEIDVDPNSGTTLGIIPTWLTTDDKGQVRTIIAPDVLYNPYFGFGARGRIFSYPSEDTQWSAVAGVKQRVESEFDYEYQTGRLRDSTWSFSGSAVYDRSGTPRFYGIGNHSPIFDETNYTLQQKYLQSNLGWNLSHELQFSYTLRIREVAVQPGSLAGIASLESRFGQILGVGVNHEVLNRFAITYDTRDDPTIPTQGGAYTLFGGVADRTGIFHASLYSLVGFDARQLWSVTPGNVVAAHMALRYMPGTAHVPFWSLSTIGGDSSVIGEQQPLRGFGEGRFYDRNSFSSSVEYRHRMVSVDAMATHIDVEVTPFVDAGQVFAHSRTSPVSALHKVAGLGFRGMARPFVVGFVDIGYGSEGAAVFTGINYPF